jgi:small subunit ribosomal protein S16
MLVIRMQRTGRKGHAMFRVIVQDSRRTPTSGKIVAPIGNYDPHTKAVTINKEKAQFYLDHGAQPSDRVALLLKAEDLKLPAWVTPATTKERKLRNPEKLRRNQPDEPAAGATEQPSEAPAEEAPAQAEPVEPAAEAAPEESTDPAETEASESSDETTAAVEELAKASEPATEPTAALEEPTDPADKA